MDLSIIIVSWNTRALLAQCLASIYANPPAGEFEVWVVDNASSDGSATMVQKRLPQVKLIENPENVGFARANNQAIRKSSGQHVLLLNSDTMVRPNALTNMVAFIAAHPEAGIVGANILNADGTPQSCYGSLPSLLSEAALAWGLDTLYPFLSMFITHLGVEREFVETDWVVGAALMVRQEVLDRVGLLDESYFMYSEEIDLAHRVRRAGWKTYALRDVCIVHLGQQSSKQAPAAMKAQLFRSKVLYFEKYHGRIVAFLLRVVFESSIVAKCWVYRLQGKNGLSQMWSETRKYFASSRGSTKRQVAV